MNLAKSDRRGHHLGRMAAVVVLAGGAVVAGAAGAHAADLPVKAKAAEYVKVCAAYGPGFYYIPGSDTCLKIGGYIWLGVMANATESFNPQISNETLSDRLVADDTVNKLNSRVRAIAQFDARNQTEYGTLRAFVGVGANLDSWAGTNGSTQVDLQNGFIQFAGFTAGYTTSVFQPNLNYMFTNPFTQMNRKVNLLSYTTQFSNGFSASIAVEDSRQHGVMNAQGLGPTIAALHPTDVNVRGGSQAPDVVGSLRLEQAWGLAQLSLAAHQSRVAYNAATFQNSTDSWGWAIGGSLEFKLPQLGAGDSIFVTAAYGDGAMNYVGFSGSDRTGSLATQFGRVDGSGFGAFYQLSDVVYNDVTGGFDSTKAWSITGQFRHFWTPGLRSAVLGGYVHVDAPDSAYAFQNGFVNFDIWQLGFNTVWSPVRNLDIGAEVLYSKVESGKASGYNLAQQNLAITKNQAYGGSTDLVSAALKIQRSF